MNHPGHLVEWKPAMRESPRRPVLLAIALAVLAGCPAPAIRGGAPVTPLARLVPDSPVAIAGRVDFGEPGRAVSALLSEVASAATVSLINVASGYTVATTLTNEQGGFALTEEAIGPQPSNVLFYLEAYKGLSAGTAFPNRVGADKARVRTLVMLQNGRWVSLTNLVGGSVTISPATTASSILVSLRSLTPASSNRQLDGKQLLGRISGDNLDNPFPALLPTSLFSDAVAKVREVLREDRDPFANLTFDQTDPLFNTLFKTPRPISVSTLLPDTQFVGGQLDVVGSGFSSTLSDNTVAFSGVNGTSIPATVVSVSADGSRLRVTVPSGAISGPLRLRIRGSDYLSPGFYLGLQSGHESADTEGNLYLSNEAFGTISQITPAGRIKTFKSGLSSPRSLTIRQNKLYVACAGSLKGVQVIDLANPAAAPTSFGTTGAIADPRGIAFASDGKLFVSDAANARIYRIDSAASTPQILSLSGVTLSQPRGLAYGPDGNLYVACYGANTVARIEPATGNTTTFLQGFSFPWGLTFDSLGNLYVSNNRGDSVAKWDATTNRLASFASVTSPGGLAVDRGGYVYAIDTQSNNVYRITSEGAASLYAAAISSPTGVTKVGNVLYVLSSTNNTLTAIDTVSGDLTTLARGFSNPLGLAYDGIRDCFYVSNQDNGTLVRVDRSTGAITTLMVNMGHAAGIAYRAGKLYLRSNASVVAYDVTNLSAAPVIKDSILSGNAGFARDVSGGTFNNCFYIASGNNRILRVRGETGSGGYGSASAANHVEIFREASQDANLSSPRDVAVDGSGNVWVLNTGSNTLTSYKPDGSTHLAAIALTGSPRGLIFDGTRIWVALTDSSQIVGRSPATGAVTVTLSTGTDRPLNACVSGADMFVTCNEGVGKIAGYAGGSPSYSRIYGNTQGYSDVEVLSDGSIVVMGGGGRRILPDLSTDVAWYSNYHGPSFMWKGSDDVWITDAFRLTRAGYGYWVFRLMGQANWISGWRHAGIDSNGFVYENNLAICSTEISSRMETTGTQREWCYDQGGYTCWVPMTGSYAADAQGRMFITGHAGLGLRRVNADGSSNVISGIELGSDQRNLGSWAEPDGATVYQTNMSSHRLERITISGTSGTRTVLPFGLSSAEM
jgi:sugar lactone lactonase YvrE